MTAIYDAQTVPAEGLESFERAIAELDRALLAFPAVRDAAFQDTADWRDLLTYKLVPHLAGEGCLVAAITGGTNTGKSTVFNLLLGRVASPMVNTAAATCHPVIAANARRAAQCLDGKLVPEFRPEPLEALEQATDTALPVEALFVVEARGLPDELVIMDTPDVDSIEKRNWEVADHLRAAGDVLVAVLTAEKYKDQRVVEFFRDAAASARLVLPVMNKANPADDYAVARRQLEEFTHDVGIDAPRFVIAHDFAIGDDLAQGIVGLDGTPTLLEYLKTLDVHTIKDRVYEGTIARFTEDAAQFVDRLDDLRGTLRGSLEDFHRLAKTASEAYDPAPGREVGGLFHAFVQSKRGVIRRSIGATSATMARGVSAVGRRVTSAFMKRTTLDSEAEQPGLEKLRELHAESVARIARSLAAKCVDTARAAAPPARKTMGDGFTELDVDVATEAILGEVLEEQPVSDAFRAHANATLEKWWADHTGRRRALEALDTILAAAPAAIAGWFAIHTAGIGAAEAMVFTGPLAAQFVSRVMEYQFGDALFDFLSPWKREQQERLERSLVRHIVEPSVAPLEAALDVLNRDTVDTLGRQLAACRTR